MIIGTAGHIDHGKSTLVTALTGRAMDRLAEERRRGITIELGFAPLLLEGLPPLGIVDVPGHEDFVRTMVAGATGIDLVLLVVDAVEGIRPQTLEHLAIVEQLGIPRGIPVITKIDLADPEWIDLVAADLAERLAHSPVRFRDPVRVSPVTGAGMDQLRSVIRQEAGSAPARAVAVEDLLRLPIDRAFPVAGTGPVVTGTLWSGQLSVGNHVVIEPGGLQARVRSIESFGESLTQALPGARTAVGLAGVEVSELHRGQVLLDAPEWKATLVFDAAVTLLASAPRPLVSRTRVRIHQGTAEVIARVYPRKPIAPGQTGATRVILEAPLLLRGNDRFVVRSYSPVTTIGGGWVADPDPPRKASWPEGLVARGPGERLLALLQRRSLRLPVAAIPRLTGQPDQVSAPGITEIDGFLVLSEGVNRARETVLSQLQSFHQREPSIPGLSAETIRSSLGRQGWLTDHLLERLEEEGRVVRAEGRVALAGHRPVSKGGEGEVERVVDVIRASGLEAPLVSEIAARHPFKDLAGAIRLAVSRGLIEPVDRDRYVSREAVLLLEAALLEAGKGNAEISPAAMRDRLSLTRKHLIPLLEFADRKGLTWRDREGVRRLKK